MKKISLGLILLATSLIARENPFVAINSTDNMGKATSIKDTRKNFVRSETQLPSSARILKKLELHYQNLDGSITSQTVEIDEKIDWHDILVLKRKKDEDKPNKSIVPLLPAKEIKKPKLIKFGDIISFEVSEESLHVKSTDKKIRDFLVTNPYKIVMDFKKELSFYTKTFETDMPKFASITIGKHAGYYRVAIKLDGQYTYNLKKSQDGYIVTLK